MKCVRKWSGSFAILMITNEFYADGTLDSGFIVAVMCI